MAFTKFGTLIGQYNASLPTLTDGDMAVVSVDVNGRAMVSDGGGSLTVDGTVAVSSIAGTVAVTQSTSPWVVDGSGYTQPVSGTFWQATQPVSGTFWQATQPVSGTVSANCTQTTSPWVVSNGGTFAVQVDGAALTALELLDDLVLTDGAAWVAGSKGAELLAVRKDAAGALTGVADGDLSPLQVNANGELKVAGTFSVQVDDVFESGTEADIGADELVDGLVPITIAGFATLATIAVGAGSSLFITGLDFSADKPAQWELIVDDDGTPSKWIRAGNQAAGSSKSASYERAIEVVGAADRSVILRALSLQGSGVAGGGINAYIR